MAVILRLRRAGKKKNPFYHIVAADSRAPRDGKYLDRLGTFDPKMETDGVTVDDTKVQKWLNNGACISDTVKALIKKKHHKSVE